MSDINKLVALLQTQTIAGLTNGFIDGAAMTDAWVVSAQPKEMRVLLPGHVIVPLDDIHKIPAGKEVMFDPSAMVAIINQLSGRSLRLSGARRQTTGYIKLENFVPLVKPVVEAPVSSPVTVTEAEKLVEQVRAIEVGIAAAEITI